MAVLDFQELRILGEIDTAGFCDEDHVFKPHAAEAFIIKAGFDSDNVAGLEDVMARADARLLVNVESETVAGPVKKSLHAALDDTGFKSKTFKILMNGFMYAAVL